MIKFKIEEANEVLVMNEIEVEITDFVEMVEELESAANMNQINGYEYPYWADALTDMREPHNGADSLLFGQFHLCDCFTQPQIS